jgi:hypothetical protein
MKLLDESVDTIISLTSVKTGKKLQSDGCAQMLQRFRQVPDNSEPRTERASIVDLINSESDCRRLAVAFKGEGW